jgi:hypothetical protein
MELNKRRVDDDLAPNEVDYFEDSNHDANGLFSKRSPRSPNAAAKDFEMSAR